MLRKPRAATGVGVGVGVGSGVGTGVASGVGSGVGVGVGSGVGVGVGSGVGSGGMNVFLIEQLTVSPAVRSRLLPVSVPPVQRQASAL